VFDRSSASYETGIERISSAAHSHNCGFRCGLFASVILKICRKL
jgi:hypothetical protein